MEPWHLLKLVVISLNLQVSTVISSKPFIAVPVLEYFTLAKCWNLDYGTLPYK